MLIKWSLQRTFEDLCRSISHVSRKIRSTYDHSNDLWLSVSSGFSLILICCGHSLQVRIDVLTLSRPWVKKSWKIKRIAISKLVLGILIMCERISVYLCVHLSVCKVLVFRKLLLHLGSYGNKLYIKKFLKPLEVSWNLLWLKKSLRARHIAQLLDPPFQNFFIYQDRRLKFVSKNCSYKMKYYDMNICELRVLSRNINASIVHILKVQ